MTSTTRIITQADQLPRRTATLDRAPSAVLDMTLEALDPLVEDLVANLTSDLTQYDIRDSATLRTRYEALVALALAQRRWEDIPGWTNKIRSVAEKAGAKYVSGAITELLAQQQLTGTDSTWLGAAVAARFSAMPWGEIEDAVKLERAQCQSFAPDLLKGTVHLQFDPVAAAGDGAVPEEVAVALVQARVQLELLTTDTRDAIVSALQALIDSNAGTEARPDIWSARQISIPRTAIAEPVTIGIWDSGVDLSLYQAAPERGLAFDNEFRPTPNLLRPLGEAESRWPELRDRLTGFQDLRTGIDSPAARAIQSEIATLKTDAVKDYMESLALVGMYAHGTHVAGIAVTGNPFARVFAGALHFHHRVEPLRPSEAQAQRLADAFTKSVEAIASAGARVVNMSWGLMPQSYEDALAYHGIGDSREARHTEARRLFDIGRNALHAAILSAPQILFVAASGNSNNSADFDEIIPSSLDAPNLLTTGAVDATGRETVFSTFGETVVVHANGFAVDSDLPGGDRAKLSGTSMAAPQVTNLAAKLLALRPGLTALEVKDYILRGAERVSNLDGTATRVNLINPMKSAMLADIRIDEVVQGQ